MTTTQATKTPGYNCRLAIYFTTTKTGKRAYYIGRGSLRAFPIGVAEAEMFIAQGQADQIAGNPTKMMRG